MRVALALFLALLLGACAPEAPRAPVVLAAASLQGALDKIADEWARQGHARPVLSYAGSPAIARQAHSGAPADVAVLADAEWMDTLAAARLIEPGTRRDVTSNRLVVVRRKPATDGSLAAALAGERIALGEPETVPAGRYAKTALETLGLWQSVAPRMIVTDNVRAALALAERGEVAAAVVYASDAAATNRVAVAATIPADTHPPIRYPAALLASAANADAAGFVEFLSSPQAARIFARHGFAPLAEAER